MDDFLDILSLVLFAVSILWIHLRLFFRRENPAARARILFLDAVVLSILLIGIFSPPTYFAFMQEDYIGEWITFYAFACCTLIICAHLWCSRRDYFSFFSLNFLIPLVVAAFCLFAAGEEISWGQRIFSFMPPDFFLEQNYQQELNIHNLFKGDGLWGIKIESKHIVMLTAFFYGILFPLVTRLIAPLKIFNKHAPAFYLLPFFLLVIAMEQVYPLDLTGEGCELFLGILFLIHIFDAYPVNISNSVIWKKFYTLPALKVLVFILGIMSAPLLNLIIYGSEAKAQAVIMQELQLLQKDFLNRKAPKAKILGRRRVHKRIYSAIEQNYFRLPQDSLFLEGRQTPADPDNGTVRNDRRGYFLDPWNNPYWVYYYRKKKRMIFYSFGPNRKRDSNLSKDPNLVGDDIGIIFNVTR